MATLTSCLLAYLGCGLLYQAKPKRCTLALHYNTELVNSNHYTTLCRLIGTALLFVSIYCASMSQGLERGLTIWLGIVSACGFLGLFLSAWNKHSHLPSMFICTALLLLVLLANVALLGTAE